jgi:hypothetical protein
VQARGSPQESEYEDEYEEKYERCIFELQRQSFMYNPGWRKVSNLRLFDGVLLLAVLASLTGAPARAELSDLQRSSLLESNRVGNAVLGALERADRVRVLVAFSVPEPRSPGARAAIRARGSALLLRMAPGEFELHHRYQSIGFMALSATPKALQQLLLDGAVRHIDLDRGGSGSLAQAMPLAALTPLQELGLTGQGVRVAVLDSGVDLEHPDLADSVVAEHCFCSGDGGCCPLGAQEESGPGSAQDDHGHGSNVTGIITSDGIEAPQGGAPAAEIVAVKVLDENNTFCCSSDVVAGLEWIIASQPEVDVVNLSLGTFALYDGDCDDEDSVTLAYAAVIDALRANGVLTVVASGNDVSGSQMRAPACVANALSVGAVYDSNQGYVSGLGCTDATTQADQVTCFSNSNASTDLFAPGARTTSTRLGGGTSTMLGTSQATPLVAACSALLLAARPSIALDQLELALESSPVRVVDASNGLDFPRLDCMNAYLRISPASIPSLSARGPLALLAILLAVAAGRQLST